ncbi:MAG: xanthine dehydrogenase family protein molybdopterin-binding subunit [Candidatus Binatia bacterium]
MKPGAIGRGISRVEGPGKVTGQCLYAADIIRPNALWGGFLRSPLSHARIVNIDVSRARKVPGVKAVITGNDVSPRREGCALEDKPVLARERALYSGEKIAGVAAVDKDTVEEALALIAVEYEELPAVFDPFEAMKPDAPILHPDYAAYKGPKKCLDPALINVHSVERSLKGDIERGFAEADEIFANTFRTHRVHQAFLEPRAGVVEIDRQGRVLIWHCHQAPFLVRRWLSVHSGIPEAMIVVEPVLTGGSFGGKLDYEDVLCLYYLARASGRPVKYVQSYAEEFVDGQPRHPAVVTLRAGVKRAGRLWALDGKVYYNGGAYGARTPRNGLNGTFLMAGGYRTPHVRMEGYMVYTNQPPCGYFRAPGEAQTLFAVESHIDTIAEAMGLDPLEFRLRNVLRAGDTMPTGEPLRDPRGREVLRRLARISGWKKLSRRKSNGRRGNLLIGRGVAFGVRHIGTGESGAQLFLEPDGALRLATSVRDVGVGAHTMHRQVAAEILGVASEQVRIDVRGTDSGAYDEGVRGQRGTHIEGLAVARAADALVELLRKGAAQFWQVEPERVKWKRAYASLTGSKRERLSLKQLARLAGGRTLCGVGHCKAGRPDVHVFQALVAEVEVNAETGKVKVRRFRHVVDATKIINPIIFKGQIEGGLAQGLGFSLMEYLALADGQVTTLSFGDYKIPTIRDVPPLTISVVKAREGPGPFGAKSVAECGIGVAAPAIANAIYDATGVRVLELPITPEQILKGRAENGYDSEKSKCLHVKRTSC